MNVEVDPSQRFIKGLAELTIQPLNNKLTNIRVNCRQCNISKVFVNDTLVEYEYNDTIAELSLGSNTNIAHHQVYKSKYLSALRDSDEGELLIKLPADCIVKAPESQTTKPFTSELPTPTGDNSQPTTSTTNPEEPIEPIYNSLIIKIEYTLQDPRNGIAFVQKDDEITPYRSNHVYTVHQPNPGATRSWVPCIDKVSERCTWDMEFIVPRKVDGALVPEYDGEGAFDEVDGMMVVCSGDVVEQVIHPTDTTKKIVHYSLSVPTSAPFIGFAIGPFEMIKLSPSQLQEEVMTAADLDENQQQSLMAEINMMQNIYAFALPGLEEELSVTCSFLMHAMHFYTQEYGSYPFSDYKLVFVEDAWSDTASSASLSICSSRLLHPVDVIDQIYNTRRILSQALARQWFGIYIVQKSWPDIWLVRGLANLMGSLFIKRHLGNNEYRLRLKKDMELCCMLDINRPPVYNPALPYPLDPDDLDFIDLKAPLVIYMLDKRMCKGGGTLGLSRVLPKILVSAMSGELPQNAISTHYFLRLCRKVSGFDTKVFAEQWVYRSGCPKFSFSFHFNRKKMVVEIYMSQENTNVSLLGDYDSSNENVDGNAANYLELMSPIFTGNLTVRIHEADGTPYEHILDIQSNKQKFEVQFNTKYKRIRRNTKRFLAKQAAAAAAVAEEEQENEEGGDGTTVLGIISSLGLGMPTFEDPSQKSQWKIVEWGQDEEDTSGAASAMFDWIRLDAEFEWLCVCEFKQPDYMWAAQLTKDRDVVAQHEAIEALKHMPSLPTSTSLLRAVLDPKCFYKIRMEATYGLATCAIPSLNWVGLLQLHKMFAKQYCFPVHNQTHPDPDNLPMVNCIPKPNNFSNLPDYFIQKSSVVAFSQIRDDRGLTPVRIRQFLLDLLKYNDNIGNEFSDCYYVASLVSSLGDSLIPAPDNPDALLLDDAEGERVNAAAKAEIERFRTLDYVIPTYHNIVTVTCLRTMTKLMLKDLMPVNVSLFMQYTRYGNYLEVRLTAFDSLFILCGLSDEVLNKYLLDIIKEDQSVYVSHYVARSLLAWLGLALKQNSESNLAPHRFIEEFAEEEGRVIVDDEKTTLKKTAQQEFQGCIENLRKRFENNLDLQQKLWNLLNTPDNAKLDHSIRKYLLQFCEYMYKPIDMGLKVTIRVPTMSSIPDTNEETSEPQTPTGSSIIRLNKPKEKSDEKPAKPKKATTIHIKAEPPVEATAAPIAATETVSSPTDIEAVDMMDIDEPHVVKEVPVTVTEKPRTPSPAPPPPPKPKHKKVDSATAEELKKCRRVINKLNKSRSALLFIEPVDEVLDGAPGYYTLIKKPMDLGKIKRKVEQKEYTKFSQFEDDVRLMFSNCFTYNSPGTYVYNEGMALEAIFEKELANLGGTQQHDESHNMTIVESPAKAPQAPRRPSTITPEASPSAHKHVPKPKPVSEGTTLKLTTTAPTVRFSSPVQKSPEIERKKSIPSVDTTISHHPISPASEPSSNNVKPANRLTLKEKMDIILHKTMTSPHAYEFSRPVDPVKQGVPHYFKIIKTPMDLGTIKSRLRNNFYTNAQAFDDDVKLVFRNCYTFNPPNTYVYEEAKQLEETYTREWKKYFDTRRTSVDKEKQPSVPSPVIRAPPPAVPVDRDVVMSSPTINNTSSTIRLKPPQEKVKPKPPKIPRTDKAEDVTHVRTVSSSSTSTAPSTYSASPTAQPTNAPMKPRLTEKEKMELIHRKLITSPHAYEFSRPVDPVKQGVPHYFKIIKTPMDLGTIENRLRNNYYTNIQTFDEDVKLVFRNCYTFNPPDTYVYNEAKQLEEMYARQWRKYFGSRRSSMDKKPMEKHSSSPSLAKPDVPVSSHSDEQGSSTIRLKPPQEKVKLKSPKLDKMHIDGGYHSKPSSSTNTPTAPSATPPISAGSDNRPTIPKPRSKTPESAHVNDKPKAVPVNPEMTEGNKKRCDRILKKIVAHQASTAFHVPVDAVALGIPQYYDIIKRPMDLSAIRRNLSENRYKTIWEFERDIRQIFWNCYGFNDHESWVVKQCQALETYFNRIWSTDFAHPNALKGDDKRVATKVVNKLTLHDSAALFNEPVDLDTLPDYGQIIKHPMDLRTIWERLESGKYTSLKALDSDIRLVFKNCFTYNAAGTIGYEQGKKLEKYYQTISKELRTRIADASSSNTNSKRKFAELEGKE